MKPIIIAVYEVCPSAPPPLYLPFSSLFRITQVSSTRGHSTEPGAAITVLLASRLALPVSTTQCLIGACMGVALMNLDARAVNWRQLAFIFGGWVLTLPAAGLLVGC